MLDIGYNTELQDSCEVEMTNDFSHLKTQVENNNFPKGKHLDNELQPSL